MWMDITILILVLASAVLGYFQGFTRTFLHTVGWVLGLVLGFVWYPAVVDLLKSKTGLYDAIYLSASDKLASAVTENLTIDSLAEGAAGEAGGALTQVPAILFQMLRSAAETVTDTLAIDLAELLIKLVALLLIVAVIKLAFWLLIALFSKKDNDGITGWFDGIFGAALGGLKGIAVVLILLALLAPAMELASDPSRGFFRDSLEESKLAQRFYNGNVILLLVSDLSL